MITETRIRARGRPTAMPMPRRVRKNLLTLHVITSVTWLGLDLAFLVLGITGLVTSDPATRHGAYLTLGVLSDTLLIPVSLGALITGLLLGIGTRWGLLRHYWVATKLVLTLIAVGLVLFSMRNTIAGAVDLMATVPAENALAVDTGRVGLNLVIAPSVGLVIYVSSVVLSVFKPWGKTAYGARRGSAMAEES